MQDFLHEWAGLSLLAASGGKYTGRMMADLNDAVVRAEQPIFNPGDVV